MTSGDLLQRAERAKAWMLEACFPLWSVEGVGQHGFRERLDLSHRALKDDDARVRVQGRQAYLFAAAHRLGWQRGRCETLLARAVETMTCQCRREDGLFGRQIASDGSGLSDKTADLYDTAFCLFGLAHAARIDHLRPACWKTIIRALDAVDDQLSDPAGGFAEALPHPVYRHQNPHMHLLEAYLALHEAFPEEGFLTRVEALRTLALERFIDVETGVLWEFFERDWTRPSGTAGGRIEPGHQFEWVWLLDKAGRALGEADLSSQARRLYEVGVGTLDDDGRAIMAVGPTGSPTDTRRRTWVETEALKAHLVMWFEGDEAAGMRAAASFDHLMADYLTAEGGWIDHYDANGAPIAGDMPASTGYHIVLAFEELIARTAR